MPTPTVLKLDTWAPADKKTEQLDPRLDTRAREQSMTAGHQLLSFRTFALANCITKPFIKIRERIKESIPPGLPQ